MLVPGKQFTTPQSAHSGNLTPKSAWSRNLTSQPTNSGNPSTQLGNPTSQYAHLESNATICKLCKTESDCILHVHEPEVPGFRAGSLFSIKDEEAAKTLDSLRDPYTLSNLHLQSVSHEKNPAVQCFWGWVKAHLGSPCKMPGGPAPHD